ncbi:MAG: thiolase family protein [Thermaerobacter sp.]|nr:thiolase family protein [Thermaerobacter sp.]
MADAVIVSSVRTAIARAPGALQHVPAEMFGAAVMREAIRRAQVEPREVEDVIWGNVMAGGGNMGRLTALQAGLPVEVPGVTVDRQCGSGLQSICFASQAIKADDADILLAGGSDSMTRAPFLMERPDSAYPRRAPRFYYPRLSPESIGDPPMGVTAENVAVQYRVSREDQDAFALRSQQNAARAIREGRFAEQIVPIPVPAGKGETVLFAQDEHPRPDTSLERLAALRPVFQKDGTVTAGNASGINDGAGAAVLMSAETAAKKGLAPLGRIVAWAVAGVDPNLMGMGPVPAVQKVLRKANMTLQEIDLIELNEAFASQSLACIRELRMDPDRVNVNGGAIALGHPIAGTGAILTAKLLYELRRSGGRFGMVTACIGGGQGIATIFERL